MKPESVWRVLFVFVGFFCVLHAWELLAIAQMRGGLINWIGSVALMLLAPVAFGFSIAPRKAGT
jgi:hypothetical protein